VHRSCGKKRSVAGRAAENVHEILPWTNGALPNISCNAV
jgi:hypothetical protein